MKVKLVIQAGHNPPKDPGAIAGKIIEAYENLKMEARVHKALYEMFTKTPDLIPEIKAFRGNIAWKATQINLFNPLLAVELHFNAASSDKAKGHETIYSLNPESKELAEDIDFHLDRALPDHSDRGIKVGYYRQDPSRGLIGLFRRVLCPCVIPEPLFITNAADRAILRNDEKMEKIAWAIARGIMTFIRRKVGWSLTKEVSHAD